MWRNAATMHLQAAGRHMSACNAFHKLVQEVIFPLPLQWDHGSAFSSGTFCSERNIRLSSSVSATPIKYDMEVSYHRDDGANHSSGQVVCPSTYEEETVSFDPGVEEEAIVYEIDTEKLSCTISLLQSSVDDSLEFSLESLDLDLHGDFVIKVLETPHILGENLIRFFKWVMMKESQMVTTPLVYALTEAIHRMSRQRDAYTLWFLIKEMAENQRGIVDANVINKLISLFSNLGRGHAALDIFNSLESFGIIPDSLTCYYTVEALLRRSSFDRALPVLDKMLNAGELPDTEKVGKMISLCCKENHAKTAYHIYLLAKHISKLPKGYIVHRLIASLCREEEMVGLAREILSDFSKDARKHEIKSFMHVIRGFCRIKDIDGAKELLLEMISKGPPPGNAVFNSIITGYCKSRNLDKAMEMLRLMKSRGLKPDIYTYTVIMSGYASGGQMEEATRVLLEAKTNHLKLCPVTYHAIIRGFCKREQFDRALELFREMSEFGVRPSLDECNKLIQSLCLKALDWKAAEEVHAGMKEKGLHLNAITKCLIEAVKELEANMLEKS